MNKIWLDRYPAGVPHEIDADRYGSLLEVIQEACTRFAGQPAFTNLGRTLDYAEIDARSRDLAAFFQQGLGLGKGERIAVMMPNVLQFPVAVFAALRAGLVVVPVNPLYTARELGHQLADSGAGTIVILANFAHVLEKVLGRVPVKHVVVTELGDMLPLPRRLSVNLVVRHVKKMVPRYRIPRAIRFNDALGRGRRQSLRPVAVDAQDMAFLQYTGGTTGLAKGAMLTHRNLVANVEQVLASIGEVIEEGKEVIVTALPMYHIFSLTVNCLCLFKYGALNLLITNPRDIPAFVTELGKWRFTVLTGVNTLFNALANDEAFKRLDFGAFKLVVGGGMAVQRAVAERWQRVTGVHILEGYGLTEASPVVTVNPTDLSEYTGSIGLPLPSTEVSIRDEEDRELATGERGELCVRGPQVMLGYWGRPEETAKVLSEDGWLHTGDVATIDEQGFVRIVDRKKDVIVVSGFNVFPNEVEDVAATCEGVSEVACAGVPDEEGGEVVKLFVVRVPGSGLSAEQLIAHCRQGLTGYKVPRRVEFRDELPKTTVGKILRRALREAPAETPPG